MRICGFVVNTHVAKLLFWTEMLISRKVAEVSEIPHVNLRAEWKELIKLADKSFQFFFGARCGPKTVIYVAAEKFWLRTVELIENLFFFIANK